jgi:hypothetical protein
MVKFGSLFVKIGLRETLTQRISNRRIFSLQDREKDPEGSLYAAQDVPAGHMYISESGEGCEWLFYNLIRNLLSWEVKIRSLGATLQLSRCGLFLTTVWKMTATNLHQG